MSESEPPANGVKIDNESLAKQTEPHNDSHTLTNKEGWDGKLRMPPKNATLTNPEALSDPDYSDPEAPPAEQIEADEDLLDDYPEDTEDIDLVHCRISSMPALRLERFKQVERICLRQNAISSI